MSSTRATASSMREAVAPNPKRLIRRAGPPQRRGLSSGFTRPSTTDQTGWAEPLSATMGIACDVDRSSVRFARFDNVLFKIQSGRESLGFCDPSVRCKPVFTPLRVASPKETRPIRPVEQTEMCQEREIIAKEFTCNGASVANNSLTTLREEC